MNLSQPGSDLSIRELIRTHPDLSELAVPQALDELKRLPRDFPHVFGFDGQIGKARHAFVTGDYQSAA